MTSLISAKQVGALLGMKVRVVLEKMILVKGFPRPYRFPTPSGGFGHPRWKLEEIEEWVEKYKT